MKWPGNIAEARATQERLREQVRIIPFRGVPRLVAGVDAAFSETRVFAAVCLYSFPTLSCIARSFSVRDLLFPYVPGYLSFREGPAIIEAIEGLPERPDVILVDGQGIAHPRGIGIASHIGVLMDLPAIGCAKTRLVGDCREPGARKGSSAPLRYRERQVGAVVRTRDSVAPLFISPGHLIDGEGSVRIALSCVGAFRIPEPLRCADRAAKQRCRSQEACDAVGCISCAGERDELRKRERKNRVVPPDGHGRR